MIIRRFYIRKALMIYPQPKSRTEFNVATKLTGF